MASVPSDEVKQQFFAALVGNQPDIVRDLVTQYSVLATEPIKVSDFLPRIKEVLEGIKDFRESFKEEFQEKPITLPEEHFLPPLAIAAMPDKDRRKIAEILLNHHANVNVLFDELSFRATHALILEDAYEKVVHRLKLEMNYDPKTSPILTPLDSGLRLTEDSGDPDHSQSLLLETFFKERGGLNRREATSSTILVEAMKQEDSEKVTRIINGRPELLDAPILNCPPIIWATVLNKPEYLEQLDKAGANLQAKVGWVDFGKLYSYLHPNDEDYLMHLDEKYFGDLDAQIFSAERELPPDALTREPEMFDALKLARLMERKEIASYLEQKEKEQRISPHADRRRPEHDIKDDSGEEKGGDGNDKTPGGGGLVN